MSVSISALRLQQSQRKPVPAPMTDLLAALRRLRVEAVLLAEEAYQAIQHHSYEPYWHFRDKLGEHAALVEVIRGRVPRLKEGPTVAERVDQEEHEILIVATQACLKFSFALSAKPLLPIGARETFMHEVDSLKQARQKLLGAPAGSVPDNLLDELDTTLMILEEIIEKSPSLIDFAADRRRASESEGEAASGAAPAAA